MLIESLSQNSEFKCNLSKLQSTVDEIISLIKKETTKDDQEESISDVIEENKTYKQMLSENERTIKSLKVNVEYYIKKNEDLKQLENEHTSQLAQLTEETAKNAYEDQKRNMKLMELEAELKLAKKKIEEYEAELENYQKIQASSMHISKRDLKRINEQVKDVMNQFYSEICQEFEAEKQYDSSTIKKALAPVTVCYTYKILSSLEDMLKADKTNK